MYNCTQLHNFAFLTRTIRNGFELSKWVEPRKGEKKDYGLKTKSNCWAKVQIKDLSVAIRKFLYRILGSGLSLTAAEWGRSITTSFGCFSLLGLEPILGPSAPWLRFPFRAAPILGLLPHFFGGFPLFFTVGPIAPSCGPFCPRASSVDLRVLGACSSPNSLGLRSLFSSNFACLQIY